VSTGPTLRMGQSAAIPLPRPAHSQEHITMSQCDVVNVCAAGRAWRMRKHERNSAFACRLCAQAGVRPHHFLAPRTHNCISQCRSAMWTMCVLQGEPAGLDNMREMRPSRVDRPYSAHGPECGHTTSSPRTLTTACHNVAVRCGKCACCRAGLEDGVT